jgi:cytochrome c oxidase subunit 1
MIRLELLTPQSDLMAADTYNKVFTMHGIIMIFFFLVPSVPGALGNFFLPMMIGAKDLALPKMNLASWYFYMAGGILALWAMITGGVDTGWTFTTPLSTHYVNTNVITTGLAIFITGFSSIFTGLNFIVTIHKMRAPGMTWFRLPLFIWANYAASILMVLGTPVLAIAIVLVALERAFGIGVFDPTKGGDPLLTRPLPSRRWPSPSSASSSGPTTCSSWVCRATRCWSSRCSPCWLQCPRPSKSSIGPSPSTRVPSPLRRP